VQRPRVEERMEDFQVRDSLPLMEPKYPIMGILAYWAFIGLMLQRNRKTKAPMAGDRIDYFAIVHNMILVVLSLAMAVGVALAAYQRAQERGWFSLICGDVQGRDLMKGALGFWTYVYYVSKYYELLDTVILLLKNKPVILLHVYHHTTMILAAWTSLYYGWLEGSWWCVFVNSIIHFFMYIYYTLSLCKIDVWWKKHLTSMQIFQFMTGLVFVQIYLCYYFQNPTLSWHNGWPQLDYKQGCGGHLGTGLYAHALNFSFFCLFIRFFLQTYARKGDKMKKQ